MWDSLLSISIDLFCVSCQVQNTEFTPSADNGVCLYTCYMLTKEKANIYYHVILMASYCTGLSSGKEAAMYHILKGFHTEWSLVMRSTVLLKAY